MNANGKEPENASSSEENEPLGASRVSRGRYWSGTFILVNAILLLLAVIAGYLEYMAYPALMTAPVFPYGNGFGESNVVLNLSFLTYQYTATNPNCGNGGCTLKGIPAFDFCQGLIYLVLLINVVHLIRRRPK